MDRLHFSQHEKKNFFYTYVPPHLTQTGLVSPQKKNPPVPIRKLKTIPNKPTHRAIDFPNLPAYSEAYFDYTPLYPLLVSLTVVVPFAVCLFRRWIGIDSGRKPRFIWPYIYIHRKPSPHGVSPSGGRTIRLTRQTNWVAVVCPFSPPW